jgi:hypothetical protein
MAKNEDLTDQLRLDIKLQLSRITKANSPHIWTAIHKRDGSLNMMGYARIEGELIQKIISGQITPAAAIPQLEQEYELM